MKKFMCIIAVLCLGVGMLTGCAGEKVQAEENANAPKHPIAVDGIDYQSVNGIHVEPGSTIVMISKGNTSQYWNAVKEGAQKAVEDLNEALGYKGRDKVQLDFEGPDIENDVEDQINMIDEVLDNQPTALALAVIDRKSCEYQLEQAQENDIPVIAFDSGKYSDILESTIATDNRKAAAKAAKELCDAIGGKGKIALLLADDASENSNQRRSGFLDEIRESYPEVEVVDISYILEEEVSAFDVAKAVMQEYPDLNGYFGANEEASIGILEARAKLERGSLRIVGFDSGSEQIEAVKEGIQVGFVTQKPYEIGYAAFVAAARAAAGMPNAEDVDTGYEWVDASNIEEESLQSLIYE